jgi:hypothetical protein
MFGEREVPEAWASLLTPTCENGVSIGMVDRDCCSGEDNGASLVSNGTQADEGVWEGRHNMS